MQDGTLGRIAGSDVVEEDEVNIHIGDMVVSQSTPDPAVQGPLSTAPPAGSLLKTLLVSAALAAGPGIGVAIPWALGAFDRPDVPASAAGTDTDTLYELRIGGGGK